MGHSAPKPPPWVLHSLEDMRAIQNLRSTPNGPLFVNQWGPTPDWLASFKGYVSDRYWIPRTRPSREYNIIVSRYLDERTREPKFVVPYLLASNARPVFLLERIWRHLSHDTECGPIHCQIREDGVLTEGGKMPDETCISYIVDSICYMWTNWKDFPDVDDYHLVLKLRNSLDAVNAMRDEMAFCPLQNEIDEKRKNVQYLLESIGRLEKDLNRIYEDGADALNLLEENGCPMDIDKMVEERKKWA